MPRPLRLKIAREYLEILSETGERKTALLMMSKKHHVTGRSIENYVSELRGKK